LSISLSLPLSLYLSIGKFEMNLFCKISSVFQIDNIKKEAILRAFLQNEGMNAELTPSYQCVLRFFQSMSLKNCAWHEKV